MTETHVPADILNLPEELPPLPHRLARIGPAPRKIPLTYHVNRRLGSPGTQICYGTGGVLLWALTAAPIDGWARAGVAIMLIVVSQVIAWMNSSGRGRTARLLRDGHRAFARREDVAFVRTMRDQDTSTHRVDWFQDHTGVWHPTRWSGVTRDAASMGDERFEPVLFLPTDPVENRYLDELLEDFYVRHDGAIISTRGMTMLRQLILPLVFYSAAVTVFLGV